MRDRFWRAGLSVVLVGLAGCAGNTYVPVEERSERGAAPTVSSAPERQSAASSPYAEPAPAVSPSVQTPVETPSPIPKAGISPRSNPPPALLALLQQADVQEQAGEMQRALSYLERAQRISPREPLVYLQLARVRLQMSDYARAQQLIQRGLALTAGGSDMNDAFLALQKEVARRR